jgi:hypothetical protein
MIDMTHGANIDVRLVPLELLFTHVASSTPEVVPIVGVVMMW